ncbi:Lactonase, 7-bladed beta-propeller-domain-containing protein [Phaeosphaeriaceae sp. PMI808]|nr:Lactonase, 7-bladed beta-propeller-domain-containing protein [Phaeosphaeriaceae sp. PMI808]
MGLHHLLTGSYTNTSLYLLAFDTVAKTLTLNSTVPGFGLHQFVTSNAARDVIYATTMSEPPRIFSWSRTKDNKIAHINTANITTSSCYFSDNGNYAFSAGGSGARINAIDNDGGIGDMINEFFYVPEQEITRVDRTRSAVLYGAHGFDVNINNKGFVPHLGWDSIFMYDIAKNGTAKLLSVNLSPEVGDGPRNVYPSADGKWLYVINEHSQYLDVYEVGETRLTHKQRASVIPDKVRGKYTYRSNAVRLSRDGKTIFTSTRGWNNTEANGWVAAFELSNYGNLKSTKALTYYEAPLTLGSAAGLRVAFWKDETNTDPKGTTDYMYLSDTQKGYMYILGWTPANHTLSQVAALRYPDNAAPYEAVWLD